MLQPYRNTANTVIPCSFAHRGRRSGGGGDQQSVLLSKILMKHFARILEGGEGGGLDESFPTCAFFFFFKVETSSLGQNRSTVAQRAETTVVERFLMSYE